MRFVPYALGLCLGLGPLACSNSSTTATTIVRPELVAVSPDDFLGGAECSKTQGGVQSYVATLFDVTPATDGGIPNPGIMLESSPPTSCLELVTFGPVAISADEPDGGPPSVTAGHWYLAEVDAYDLPPNELTQTTTGSRSLTASDVPITPIWTATCGGYPASPGSGGGGGGGGGGANSAAGAAGDPGAAETPADDIPGLPSYAALTQTAHNCARGQRTPLLMQSPSN